MTDQPPSWRRRAMLAGGVALAAGWVIGAPRLLQQDTALSFRDIPGLPGFRALEAGGAVSGAQAVFFGLDATPPDPEQMALRETLRAAPCAALFEGGRGPDGTETTVPMAYFTDYNCPNCRVLETRIAALEAEAPGAIRLIRHQLPLLGPASEAASRAALAAERQGKRAALHARLISTRLVSDRALIAAIAESAGLDAARLLRDMDAPEIDRHLARSAALADLFGFYGTPGAVLGRSAFMGAIPAATLAALVEAEAAGPPPDCA